MLPALSPFPRLQDFPDIRVVGSFAELVGTPFGGGVNALCWQRTLPGDFGEIVTALQAGRGITSIDDARLQALPLSDAGRVARDILYQDLALLRAHDLQPSIDCVNGYATDPEPDLLRTDVQSWHVDSATVEADTYLCTYFGADSEALRQGDYRRRVDVPEFRAELLRLHSEGSGADDTTFHDFLEEHYLDLHYTPHPHAQPYAFGVGNLWRIATQWPGSPVPPCVHRAPATQPGQPPRLLLIS